MIIATVVLVHLLDLTSSEWSGKLLSVTVYFAVTLVHTGVRIGRRTYMADMADGDQRTVYVAVSNSAMGFIWLIVGGVSSLLALLHINWALLFLAAMGLLEVFAGTRSLDVSHG